VRVLELSLRNYRVFEEVDLELPARVIGVFGPNGAGKSTLVESIAFALYGVDAARTKKDGIRTHGLLTDCEVRMVFEHAGRQYEIRRAIKGRGHTPDAELYVGDLALATGVTEVTAEIVRLLHMDLPVFRASVFAEQKQLDALSDQTTAKRKEMALRLLGIRPVDEARSAARREARSTKASADQLADAVPDTAALEAELKEAEETAGTVRAAAKAAAAELKASSKIAKAARVAFEELDAARHRVEKLTVELEAASREHLQRETEREERERRIAKLATELAELPAIDEALAELEGIEDRAAAAVRLAERAAALTEAEAALETMPEPDADGARAVAAEAERAAAEARDADVRARTERDRAATILAEAQAHLAHASEADPSEPCPTCGQALGEGFAAYLQRCRAEAASSEQALAAAEEALAASGQAVAQADRIKDEAVRAGEEVRSAAERRARVLEQVAQLREEVTSLAAPFGRETPDPDALAAEADRARQLRERRAKLGADAERMDEAKDDLTRVADRLAELTARIAELTDEAEGLSFDTEAHAAATTALAEADAALEAARDAERAAGDETKEAEKAAERLGGELTQARQTAAKVDELRSEARYLQRTSMLLDGFRDHLVARVGPELSREAEALFRELTNHEYDDLRIHDDTLAIEIADGDAYFPIARFSGSETDLANLALRVAISTHLSRVSGADVGFMVLDEVLGSLDQERKDLMVQAMGRLASRFHQLFVITHAEQVKDQLPASIVVQKAGRRRSTAVLI
jgi:DNA repair protein SbcC/Rad50